MANHSSRGRDHAYEAFLDKTRQNPDALVLLLVDSEDSPLDPDWAKSVWATRAKQEPTLFFMVRCMEAWIVADGPSLTTTYPGKFQEGALPKRPPEECAPEELRQALRTATQNGGIGRYEKRHDPILLAMVRPEIVARRCPSAKAFLEGLDELLGSQPQ